MRVPLHPCFILHQRPYRESSLIVEVFSREHGRLGVVAKGARRSRNTRRALLQPLRKVNLAWTIRGEMGTLTDVEPVGACLSLSGARIIAAFYINELLIRLLHRHESHPELFDAYEISLEELGRVQKDSQAILRLFEKRLLGALGYGLVLDRDVVSGERIQEDRGYYFLRERGPTCVGEMEGPNIRISGATLSALDLETFSEPRQLLEAKRLMRYVLGAHLGEKPLQSRALYRQYLGFRSGG